MLLSWFLMILYHLPQKKSSVRRHHFNMTNVTTSCSQLDRPHVDARKLAHFGRNGTFVVAQPCLQWY